jgi:hypothetical protein
MWTENHQFLLEDFVIRNIISASTASTIRTPTQTPALKISPITRQLEKNNTNITGIKRDSDFFILHVLENEADPVLV